MSTSSDYRAYLNPQGALSESEQKALVEAWAAKNGVKIGQWYVESRKETREAWIGSLRGTSIAVVPMAFVIAKATGRKDTRYADFLCAAHEISREGNYFIDASTGRRSDSKKDWPLMREDAKQMLGRAVKAGKDGRPAYEYTPEEWKDLFAIADSKRLKNWPERRAAIKRRGLKVPGRTWFYNNVVSKLSDS